MVLHLLPRDLEISALFISGVTLLIWLHSINAFIGRLMRYGASDSQCIFFINFLLGRYNDKLLMQFIEFSTKLTK